MEFRFTAEQDQLRDAARRLLKDRSPSSRVRELMETELGFDPKLWQELAELGFIGAHIPEAYGGQGFSTIELGIITEEMGRALCCAPYLASSVLAATSLLYCGSEDAKLAHLPSIANGKSIATLALAEDAYHWPTRAFNTRATLNGNNYALTGKKRFVVDGMLAQLLLVAASLEDGTSALFAVKPTDSGVHRQACTSLDATRKLAEIKFCDAPAQLLSAADCATGLQQTLTLGAIALANEMVGGAQHMLQSSIDYVQLRMQFGRKIGSFQTIKHKCADMLLGVELAKSGAYYAAAVAAEMPETSDLVMAAAMAKANAADTYMQCAADCIQLHGGIGFTWDNDTHLWYKRAKCSELLLGDSNHHRERLIEHWPIVEALGASQ